MTSTAGSGTTLRRQGSRRIQRKRLCSDRPWASRSSSPQGPCRPTPWASCSRGGSGMPGCPRSSVPHSFRVLVVTDLLSQDVPLEDVQYLAGHANPRTTQIYDRRRRRVTRNIVERISV